MPNTPTNRQPIPQNALFAENGVLGIEGIPLHPRLLGVVFDYDFARDGGAVGDIFLRRGGSLPARAIVFGGWVEGITALTSGGAATVGLGVEATNDLDGPTAFNAGWAATTSASPPTPLSTVNLGSGPLPRMSVARVPKLTVAAAALTGGKFTVTILYWML